MRAVQKATTAVGPSTLARRRGIAGLAAQETSGPDVMAMMGRQTGAKKARPEGDVSGRFGHYTLSDVHVVISAITMARVDTPMREGTR